MKATDLLRQPAPSVAGCCMLMLAVVSGAQAASATVSTSPLASAPDWTSVPEGDQSSADLKRQVLEAPNNADLRKALAEAYLRENNGASAEKELEMAAALGVAKEELVVPLAQAALLQRNFRDVLAAGDAAYALAAAEQVRYLEIRGEALMQLDRLDDARDAYDSALRIDAEAPAAQLGLAQIAIKQHQPTTARSLLDSALRSNPGYAPAWSQLGSIEAAAGHYADAERAYTRALELSAPPSPEDLAARALIRADAGNFGGAQSDAQELQERAPASPAAAYVQGVILFKQGRFSQAQSAFERTLQRQPDFRNAQFYLGAAYFYQENFEQALGYLAAFAYAYPGSLSATRMLAVTNYRLGRLEAAVALLEPLLEQQPDDRVALRILAEVYLSQGNAEGAMRLAKRFDAVTRIEDTSDEAVAVDNNADSMSDEISRFIESRVELTQFLESAQTQQSTSVSRILSFVRLGKLDLALAEAEQFAQEHPKAALPLNVLGIVHLRRSENELARQTFLRALELSPDDVSALHNLAYMAATDGDQAAARDYYQQVLDRDPGHERTLWRLSELERAAGNDAQSLALLQGALARNQGSLEALLHLTQAYLDRGLASRALALLNTGSGESFTQQPAYLATLAAAQLANQHGDEAVATLRTLVSILPESASAHFMLAQAYAMVGEKELLQEQLQKTIALEPGHIRARLAAIRQMASNSEFEQAESLLQPLVDQFPNNPEFIAQTAWLAELRNKLTDAAAGYAKAFELAPTSQLARSLARVQIRAGDSDKAAETLTSWLVGHPDDIPARRNLAMIWLQRGEQEKARLQLKTILDYLPEDVPTLNNLALLLNQPAADPTEALRYAERALQLAPEAPEVLDTLGVILLDRGESVRAEELLQAAAHQSKDPDILFNLGRAYARNSKTRQARELLQSLLDSQASFQTRQQAASLLETLKD